MSSVVAYLVKNQMKRVSVIVPVYKVERYLRKCVRSILSQDYCALEVILVNDASPDGSLAICNELAAKDARVRVIDKPVNEGVDLARYSGLDAVSPESEYIMFVDSDDWLSPGVISDCVRVAEENDADIVQTGIRRVFGRFGVPIRGDCATKEERLTVVSPDVFDDLYISYFGVNILPVTLWGKLYRMDLFRHNKTVPSGLRWGEDLIMNMRLFPHVRRLATMGRVGYNYRVGGMTSHYLPNLLRCAMEMFLLKEQAIRDYNYDRGTLWARVEMKNILKTSVEQRIAYRVENGREDIAALLADPMWDRISEIARDERFASDPFVRAMAARDVDALFGYCASYTNPASLRHRLRRAILKLMC